MDVVSREELYDLVWSTPMTRVAEQFKVSGSYMARVCTVLRVPRPERGYWAKLAVGKAPEKSPLPDSQPGDQVSWSPGGELPPAPRPRPEIPAAPQATRARRLVTGTHELINNAKEHFDTGRKVEEGQHLKPYKRLMVDVTASRAALDKALEFANELFNALETKGHRVVICSPAEHFHRPRIDEHEAVQKAEKRENSYDYGRLWYPERPTVVCVGSVAFGLAVIEMSEKVELRYVNGKYIRESEYTPPKPGRTASYTFTTIQDVPCGRLRLVVYAPYQGVDWVVTFQESKTKQLTKQIPAIVKSIEHSTVTVVEEVEEAEHQAEVRRREWEAQQERWRKEEDERKTAQSIKESREQLEQVIQAWARVVSLEQFFEGVQARAEGLPETQKQQTLERLQLARDFIGTQDPLDFFRTWKTPVERYVPLSKQAPASVKG